MADGEWEEVSGLQRGEHDEIRVDWQGELAGAPPTLTASTGWGAGGAEDRDGEWVSRVPVGSRVSLLRGGLLVNLAFQGLSCCLLVRVGSNGIKGFRA